MENVKKTEEKKEIETLEKITAQKQHRAVMAWMHVSDEVLQFVEKISDGLICECLYFCAMDGMPLQEIQRIYGCLEGKGREKAETIWRERQRYLQELYGKTSETSKRIDELYQEAKRVFIESENVQKSVEKHMTYTLEMQKTLLAEQKEANKISLASKDEVIHEKEKQMQKLDQEMQALREMETSLREENRQMRQKILEQKKQAASEQVLSTSLQQPDTAASREKSRLPSKEPAVVQGQEEPTCRNLFREFFKKPRREKDAREFIESFLNNEDYNRDQREYLLRCLEDGDNIRDIRKFASPKLTVEMMERLRNLNMR